MNVFSEMLPVWEAMDTVFCIVMICGLAFVCGPRGGRMIWLVGMGILALFIAGLFEKNPSRAVCSEYPPPRSKSIIDSPQFRHNVWTEYNRNK